MRDQDYYLQEASLGNIEERRKLFRDIQDADYLVDDTNPKKYEKLKNLFTKEVWSVFCVAPYDELVRVRDKIRRGIITKYHMWMYLCLVTENLTRFLDLMNNGVYVWEGTREEQELRKECQEKLKCLTLLFGTTIIQEYGFSLFEAPKGFADSRLDDLRKRAYIMVFLLQAAQSGHMPDELLEECAVNSLTYFKDPKELEEHLQKTRAIHGSQWKKVGRNIRISYLDNVLDRQQILEQIQKNKYPIAIPTDGNTKHSKVNKSLLSMEAWSAFWVAPIDQLEQLSDRIRSNKIALHTIENMLAAITRDLPEVIRIMNNHKYKDKEHATTCAFKIKCLALLFGEEQIKEYSSALCSNYLTVPANFIALDEGVQAMWDQCKVTLRVKSIHKYEVNLALHYLKDSKLRTGSRAPARHQWENNFTVTPADVLCDFAQESRVWKEWRAADNKTTFGRVTDVHLVSTATQNRINDGSTFRVYLENPQRLLPHPILLDLHDKIAVMASLLGAAGSMDDNDGSGS